MFVAWVYKCDCCHQPYQLLQGATQNPLGAALGYTDLCPKCDEAIVLGVRMSLKVIRGGLEVVGHTTPLGVLTTDQPTNPTGEHGDESGSDVDPL